MCALCLHVVCAAISFLPALLFVSLSLYYDLFSVPGLSLIYDLSLISLSLSLQASPLGSSFRSYGLLPA